MRKLLSLILSVAVFLPGCVFDVGRFTLASNQSVEVSRLDLARTDLQRGVEGSDGTLWFLCVPIGGLPSLDRAMNEALRKGWGDFMLNCQVQRVFWTTILFSWTSYRVVGDVGNSVTARDVLALQPDLPTHGPRAQAPAPGAAAPTYVLPPRGQPDPVEPIEGR